MISRDFFILKNDLKIALMFKCLEHVFIACGREKVGTRCYRVIGAVKAKLIDQMREFDRLTRKLARSG